MRSGCIPWPINRRSRGNLHPHANKCPCRSRRAYAVHVPMPFTCPCRSRAYAVHVPMPFTCPCRRRGHDGRAPSTCPYHSHTGYGASSAHADRHQLAARDDESEGVGSTRDVLHRLSRRFRHRAVDREDHISHLEYSATRWWAECMAHLVVVMIGFRDVRPGRLWALLG